ncbi:MULTISPECIES: glycosyltransferase family 39 protein [Anaerolinea]|uniref:glycosyltransferase family 39 protein n=1 Tax=Anaerolinea TaxID=233189 RepID=UPI00261D5485|nr:glycosyltransferase family 39 protein [Anaerolinea thermophila]
MNQTNSSQHWLDRPLFSPSNPIRVETIFITLILLLTILSRFVMLGERVMSHDEVNHVWPSHDLFMGRGYAHNPVTHGPFQFHIVAFTYFLFGDNDFTSRVPAALFSTAAVAFVLFGFRRYLGRTGALIAGLLFLISPYMMYYGRYTRNEGFIELYGVVMLYAVLRHMDKGDKLSLYLLTASIVMHFVTKETAYIYVAQLLVFLLLLFLAEIFRAEGEHLRRSTTILALFGVALFLIFLAIGYGVLTAKPATASSAGPTPASTKVAVELALVLGALISGGAGLAFLIQDLGWNQLKQLRSFNLLLLTGTLILPQLTAFPVKMLGGDPLDYTSASGRLMTGGFLIFLFLLSAGLGILWNWKLWLKNAFLFYAVYIFFYTTMFTYTNGFFSGIVGSLGYWLSQQGENRGTQPIYYFALVQLPVYEYLGILGTILAVYFAAKYKKFAHRPGISPAEEPADSLISRKEEEIASQASNDKEISRLVEQETTPEIPSPFSLTTFYEKAQPLPVLLFLVYWGITSLIAFSIAGEKMPWLTVHITLGFLLAGGWGIGYLIDTTRWKDVLRPEGWIGLAILPVFLTSTSMALGSVLGSNPPFAGNSLTQLQATGQFLLSTITALATLAGIIYVFRNWETRQVLRLGTLTVFAILTILTARAAYRASFINYDYPTEYLVYAHAAPGPKQVLKQVEEISQRLTKGRNLVVAYSGDANYPFIWYLRYYPNARAFGSQPTRDLREAAVIIAGEDVFNKIDPVVGDNYIQFEYMRLWWPMEDYKNLTWERIRNAITSADYRAALWDIWLNRDYRKYAQLTNRTDLTLENWSPAARMRLYIRKDVIGKMWEYGIPPQAIEETTPEDPYQAGMINLTPDRVIGASGTNPGEFQAPRGMAIAPDGTLYVADSRNHRIQHFSADGTLLHQWGTFADQSQGDAPGGTFNEPWDVAVGLDGTVFVTDTWNHRIQAFTPDGTFLRMWGYFGQAETPDAFWGPRGLAIDQRGRVYVTDTGNKRVAIFEPNGTFVAQFGTAGLDIGQFDEPVGIAIDRDGLVYIADTWNQRVQVFVPDASGTVFTPIRQWEIVGWYGQSLENKPFLKVSPVNGHVFVTDPEGYRVLEFNSDGRFVRGWGYYSTNYDGFGLASGIAIDAEGKVWVSDGANNRLLRFTLP